MTGTVPAQAIQQQHEEIIAAVNDASDFETEANVSISTDEMLPPTNVEDQKNTLVFTDCENPTDNTTQTESEITSHTEIESDNDHPTDVEEEPNNDTEPSDLAEDDVDENELYYTQVFKSKILALADELHVEFEDIGYHRSGYDTFEFPLTLRIPPDGITWTDGAQAAWTDGTQAILRIHGIENIKLKRWSNNQGETEHTSSLHEDHIEDAEDRDVHELPLHQDHVEDAEDRDVHELQSPISTTSDSSNVSGLSGETLMNDYLDISSSDHSDSDDESDAGYGNQWERLDEALVLNLLEDHRVPAPRVLAFDVTRNNALKFPYSIQTRIPGKSAWTITEEEEATLEYRFWLAGEVAKLRTHLETVQFDEGTGRVLANEDPVLTAGRLPPNMSTRADINEKLSIYGLLMPPAEKRSGMCGSIGKTLYEALFYLVEDLIEAELQHNRQIKESQIRAYFALKEVLQDMDHIGWFSVADKKPSKTVLQYDSIDEFRILVEQTGDPSNPWRLTGVIDSDDAHAFPPILTRAPPAWLWNQFSPEVLPAIYLQIWDDNVDWLPIELTHIDADDMKVKEHYERVLIEELYTPQYGDQARTRYLDDTYGRGRWLRRLFWLARRGIEKLDDDITNPQDELRWNLFLHEWTEFKKDKNIQHEPLPLWNGVPDYIGASKSYGYHPEPLPSQQVAVPTSSSAPSSPEEPESLSAPKTDDPASASLNHIYFFS